jgi:hypothetical protein
MFKEIALDPNTLCEPEYFYLLKSQCGFDRGRYLVVDKRAWVNEATLSIKNSDLKQVRAKQFKSFLQKMLKSKNVDQICLKTDRKSISSEPWQKWWASQQQLRPFDITLSEEEHENFVKIEDLESLKDEAWNIPPSISVQRNVETLIKTLLPLLKISQEITIIDQYFRVAENLVLEQLISTVCELGMKRLTIVSAQHNDHLDQIYTENYSLLNKTHFKFSWVKVPDKFFHARFFITDKGAIQSDYGFMPGSEKGAHSDQALMNLVSKKDADNALGWILNLLKNEEAVKTEFN